MGQPTLIIVSGPAGSGKTTLAHRLAAEVGCPALVRDEIKEGMVRTVPGYVAALSDPLSLRTYQLFFDTIALWLRADVTLVAEAAFQHQLWWGGLEPLVGLADLRVVRCEVDPRINRDRMQRRRVEQASRAAHADEAHLAGQNPAAFTAIAVPAPTLDVDTSDGYRPGLAQIASFCLS